MHYWQLLPQSSYTSVLHIERNKCKCKYNLKKKHFCHDKGTVVILSIDSCSEISKMCTIIFT